VKERLRPDRVPEVREPPTHAVTLTAGRSLTPWTTASPTSSPAFA
jgi:hypothetical protein